MRVTDLIAFATVFASFTAVAVAVIWARHARRRLRHQEVLKALEAGQPLPAEPVPRRTFLTELRSGILLTSFSAGLGLCLWLVEAGRGTAVTFVPLFLGIGFLTNAAILRRYGDAHRFPDDALGEDRVPHAP